MKPDSVPQNYAVLPKELTCLTCKSASEDPVLGKARTYYTLQDFCWAHELLFEES